MLLKKGYKPVAIALFASFIFYLIDFEFFSLLAFIVAIVSVYVFRNSSRHIFENSAHILSPIDGKVIAIDKCDDKTKIYIQKSFLGESSVRAPFEGNIEVEKYQHGVNLDPNSYKANLLNEQIKFKLTLKENEDKSIKIKLISGFFNPSIDNIKHENVVQGEGLGVFAHGIVVLTIKENNMDININDSVKSGQTVISRFDK
jgi:phosphatidylserine decarboxylase